MLYEDIIIQKGLDNHWILKEYKSIADIVLFDSLEIDLAMAEIHRGGYA